MPLEPKTSLSIAPWLFVALSFAAGVSTPDAHAQNVVVRGEAVSKSDIAALNPVCRLIMENPGIHHAQGQIKNAQLFDRAEYNMAKGNGHLHHYCWALIHKQRYFRERNKTKRNFYFSQYLYDIDYVIKNSSKSWPYFDVLHAELASTHLIRGDYAATLKSADDALRFRPDSERAYAIKTDALKQMGKKEAAIKTAREGLEKNPTSSQLRQRLTKLGVTPPEPPPTPPAAAAGTASPAEAGNKQGTGHPATPGTATPPAVSAEEKGTIAPDDASTAVSAEPAVAAEGKPDDSQSAAQSKKNPYCRFCPE